MNKMHLGARIHWNDVRQALPRDALGGPMARRGIRDRWNARPQPGPSRLRPALSVLAGTLNGMNSNDEQLRGGDTTTPPLAHGLGRPIHLATPPHPALSPRGMSGSSDSGPRTIENGVRKGQAPIIRGWLTSSPP